MFQWHHKGCTCLRRWASLLLLASARWAGLSLRMLTEGQPALNPSQLHPSACSANLPFSFSSVHMTGRSSHHQVSSAVAFTSFGVVTPSCCLCQNTGASQRKPYACSIISPQSFSPISPCKLPVCIPWLGIYTAGCFQPMESVILSLWPSLSIKLFKIHPRKVYTSKYHSAWGFACMQQNAHLWGVIYICFKVPIYKM